MKGRVLHVDGEPFAVKVEIVARGAVWETRDGAQWAGFSIEFTEEDDPEVLKAEHEAKVIGDLFESAFDHELPTLEDLCIRAEYLWRCEFCGDIHCIDEKHCGCGE